MTATTLTANPFQALLTAGTKDDSAIAVSKLLKYVVFEDSFSGMPQLTGPQRPSETVSSEGNKTTERKRSGYSDNSYLAVYNLLKADLNLHKRNCNS